MQNPVLGLVLLQAGSYMLQLTQTGPQQREDEAVAVAVAALHCVVARTGDVVACAAGAGLIATSAAANRLAQATASVVYSSKMAVRSRRPNRSRGGWENSELARVVRNWDDDGFRAALRLTRPAFNMVVKELTASGLLRNNECRAQHYQVPAWFKVAVTVHHLAHGGTFHQTAGWTGMSSGAARSYIYVVCRAIFAILRPIFMRKLSQEEINLSQQRFSARRGIKDVTLAIDGTHVPWQPDDAEWMDEFRNYKGWYSVLCVALVNSFYMFVDAEVGHPGRSGDSHVTQVSAFWNDIQADPVGWLGEHGLIVSDGAFAGSALVLTPYPRSGNQSISAKQRYFNFCFSSTRIYVEQVFGMWKSRWRVCLKESDVSRSFLSLIIYATMVLHNICISYGLAGYTSSDGLDASALTAVMSSFPADVCRKCKEAGKFVKCRHINNSSIAAESRSPSIRDRRDEIADQLWQAYYNVHGRYPNVDPGEEDDPVA